MDQLYGLLKIALPSYIKLAVAGQVVLPHLTYVVPTVPGFIMSNPGLPVSPLSPFDPVTPGSPFAPVEPSETARGTLRSTYTISSDTSVSKKETHYIATC